MIFRITHKLGKKIKVAPTEALESESNPFADWTANYFRVEHVQYIILTNTASLFSAIMPGKGITDGIRFVRASLDCIHQYLKAEGLEEIYHRHIAPEEQAISFSKTGNRSVLGSMNDFVINAESAIVLHRLPPFEVNRELNRMPMSALKYKHAIEAFVALAAEKQT